jgi:predicted CopG family antitoxin
MTKKLTITVSDEVYEGLHRRVGRRKISRFIDDLARDRVVDRNASDYWLTASNAEIARGYAEAAADEEQERQAKEWIESNVGETLDDEDFSGWPGYPSR